MSEAWGGRVSDKFITENCGFLEKLIPGDMVMADWGFTVTESIGLKNAKLVIPAFTKGKSQLDPVDVEQTRGIANVRIHVERVIGLLRWKFTILEGTLPADFLICNHENSDRHTALVDHMLRVCAALVTNVIFVLQLCHLIRLISYLDTQSLLLSHLGVSNLFEGYNKIWY